MTPDTLEISALAHTSKSRLMMFTSSTHRIRHPMMRFASPRDDAWHTIRFRLTVLEARRLARGLEGKGTSGDTQKATPRHLSGTSEAPG